MKTLKMIVVLVGIVIGLFLALAAIGMIVTAMQYLFWLAVLCGIGYVSYKLLNKSDTPQLGTSDAHKELNQAQRTLEELKRKYLTK